MDKKSKELKSNIKIYVIVWIIIIMVLTFMYITDYGNRIFNILTIGLLYWLWVIIIFNIEKFRFRNYLKNHHPKIFEQYISPFQDLRVLFSNNSLDDLDLKKAKKNLKIIILFFGLQFFTIPIIRWLGRIIEQIIY